MFVCVGVGYLTFDILLQAKYDKSCKPIIFKNPLKTCFFIKKYTYKFVSVAFGLSYIFLIRKTNF